MLQSYTRCLEAQHRHNTAIKSIVNTNHVLHAMGAHRFKYTEGYFAGACIQAGSRQAPFLTPQPVQHALAGARRAWQGHLGPPSLHVFLHGWWGFPANVSKNHRQ